MASHYASVLGKKFLNKEETPLNSKKATEFGVSEFDGKFLSFLFFILFFLMVSLILVCEIDCKRLVVKLAFAQIFKIF